MTTLGQLAYEAYYNHSDGKSLISGAPLPKWSEQRPDIQLGWEAAADAATKANEAEHSCPCCPMEIRNLFAVAHNAVTRSDMARSSVGLEHWAILCDKLESLRRAVAAVRPMIDAHFAARDHNREMSPDRGMGGDAPGQRDIRCSDCRQTFGRQHAPHCHRQGLVTAASDYRDDKRGL